MSALKSSSEGNICWAKDTGNDGVGERAFISGPDVSLLEASLAVVLFDGRESIDELLDDERDSEQLADSDDCVGTSALDLEFTTDSPAISRSLESTLSN